MKTKVLIIAFLILSLVFAFAFKSHAQSDSSKTLIADETWITYTKTGARIISYSEQAFKDISIRFGEQFKSITIKYKTDRNGPYKEYAIYLSQEVANSIKEWAKTNL
jgi:hypothetical protein